MSGIYRARVISVMSQCHFALLFLPLYVGTHARATAVTKCWSLCVIRVPWYILQVRKLSSSSSIDAKKETKKRETRWFWSVMYCMSDLSISLLAFFFSRLEICNDFYRPRVFYGEVRVMLKEKKAEKGDSLRIEKKKGVDISWKQCLQIQWFSMMNIYICTRTLPQDHEIEVLWVNLTPANRKDIEQ